LGALIATIGGTLIFGRAARLLDTEALARLARINLPGAAQLHATATDSSMPPGVAVQATMHAPPRPRRWAAYAAGAVLLVGGGVAARMAVGDGDDAPVAAAVTPSDATAALAVVPDAQPVATRVTMTLVATPAEARWTVDGTACAGNPCILERTAGSAHVAVASLAGHADTRMELTLEPPFERRVTLLPLTPPDAGPVAGKPPRGGGKPPPDKGDKPPPDKGDKPPPDKGGPLEIDKSNPFNKPNAP
jgi:hypothetical protein